MILKKPLFWDLSKPNFITYLLIPFTIFIVVKNFLFKFLRKKKFPKIKTICVGNFFLGGTGEIPIVIKIF